MGIDYGYQPIPEAADKTNIDPLVQREFGSAILTTEFLSVLETLTTIPDIQTEVTYLCMCDPSYTPYLKWVFDVSTTKVMLVKKRLVRLLITLG